MLPDLGPQNPIVHPAQLYLFATACRACYLADDTKRQKVFTAAGPHAYYKSTLNDPSVPAWMAADYGGTQLVAVEGTTGAFDDPQWAGNMFAVGQTGFANVPGKVNQYFGNVGSQIAADILGVVPPGQRMTLVGHSLGGAAAAIAAHRINAARPGTVKFVVTFGAPRQGNLAWKLGQPWPLLRWVNGGDLVTNMPPRRGWVVGHLQSVTAWGPCQDYFDAGEGVQLALGGQIGPEVSVPVTDCGWGLVAGAWEQGLNVNAIPHSVGNYCLRIRRWMGLDLSAGQSLGISIAQLEVCNKLTLAPDGFTWPQM